MTTLDELFDFCRVHGLVDDDVARKRWADYVALLEQFNARANLIGPMAADEIIRTLLLDSVTCAALSRPVGRVLDVGSGAGLPGIPLKIAVPDIHLTMVEPRKKRSDFLRIARHRLQLADVDVVDSRIEELADATFDWVVSKAFRPPVEWLEVAVPLTHERGTIVCLHAAHAIDALDARAAELGLTLRARTEDVAAAFALPMPASRAISMFAVQSR